jgi:hypothetical protein
MGVGMRKRFCEDNSALLPGNSSPVYETVTGTMLKDA